MDEGAKDKRGRKKPPADDQRRGRGVRFFDDGDRLASFFRAVEVFGNFSDACKYVGVDRRVVYDERERNPEFAALLERAKLAMEFEAVDELRKGKKDKNWRRAAFLAETDAGIAQGALDTSSPSLQQLLGRTPGTFADTLRSSRA